MKHSVRLDEHNSLSLPFFHPKDEIRVKTRAFEEPDALPPRQIS